MMKAILEFDLPEDRTEYEITGRASEFYCVLWDIDQHCRQILKHAEPSKDVEEVLEEIISMIPELDG